MRGSGHGRLAVRKRQSHSPTEYEYGILLPGALPDLFVRCIRNRLHVAGMLSGASRYSALKGGSLRAGRCDHGFPASRESGRLSRCRDEEQSVKAQSTKGAEHENVAGAALPAVGDRGDGRGRREEHTPCWCWASQDLSWSDDRAPFGPAPLVVLFLVGRGGSCAGAANR